MAAPQGRADGALLRSIVAVLDSLVQVLVVSGGRIPHDFFINWEKKKETELHTKYMFQFRYHTAAPSLWTRDPFKSKHLGSAGLLLCSFVPFSTWILNAAFFLLP